MAKKECKHNQALDVCLECNCVFCGDCDYEWKDDPNCTCGCHD
jgi:hypothetical protein